MRNDDNESSSAHLTAFGNANESQPRRRLRSLVACYFNAGSDRDRDDVGNGGASCKVYYANALNGTSSSSSSSSSGAQCSRPHTPHSRRNALQCSSSRRSRSSSRSGSGNVGCSSAVVCALSLSHSLVPALIGVVAVCAVATFTFTSCSCLRCSRSRRRCSCCALHTAVLVGQVPAKLAFSRNATFASCGCPAATVQSAPRAAEADDADDDDDTTKATAKANDERRRRKRRGDAGVALAGSRVWLLSRNGRQ